MDLKTEGRTQRLFPFSTNTPNLKQVNDENDKRMMAIEELTLRRKGQFLQPGHCV